MAQFKNFKNITAPIKKGFSLIEILISFTILSISLIAVTTLISNTIQANQLNTSRLQAYFLAEQGIESIRHVRDTNWLQNIGFSKNSTEFQNNLWRSPLGQTTNITPSTTKKLIIQYNPNNITNQNQSVTLAEANNNNIKLYLNQNPQTGEHYFSHTPNNNPTQFRRYITIRNNFQDMSQLEKNLQINQFSNQSNFQLKDNLIYIESTVEYGNNYSKNITLKTILTDWKQGPL